MDCLFQLKKGGFSVMHLNLAKNVSVLAHYFSQQQFCILVEYLSHQAHEIPQKIAGYPTLITLADRVHSDEDLAPLEVAQRFPNHIQKMLHFSGKDRDIADFEHFLHAAQHAGIQDVLLLTGDKLKNHVNGEYGKHRTRYLESVNAVMAAKQQGGFHIGVAFNPFKYTQAERDAQYFKLHKKIKAGADFIVTQLGYDIDALKYAQNFLKQHDYSQKLVACVMPLTLPRAQYMVKHKVAGIVITQHMLQVLAQDQQAGLTDRAYQRCALQILICKQLGFAGIHLSACHQPKEQKRLADYLQAYQHLDLDELDALWGSLWHMNTQQELKPKVEHKAHRPTVGQLLKYHQLHFIHELFFESKLAKNVGKFIFKADYWKHASAAKVLLNTEYVMKHHVVGCESCGQCRLGDTLYVCPETCPKGLANGPCGGTSLDRCEFGDRECIHSVKARLAEAVGQSNILTQQLIPTVALETRGTSSWKNWYD